MNPKQILQNPKLWNEIFAKYPFDENRERIILIAMKEYALEIAEEAFDIGVTSFIRHIRTNRIDSFEKKKEEIFKEWIKTIEI